MRFNNHLDSTVQVRVFNQSESLEFTPCWDSTIPSKEFTEFNPKKDQLFRVEIVNKWHSKKVQSLPKAKCIIDIDHYGLHVYKNTDLQNKSKTCQYCKETHFLPFDFCSLSCAEKLFFKCQSS